MEKFGYAESTKFDTYASRMMPRDEFFTSGHRSCQGCGEALAVRWACKAIGKDAIIAHATGLHGDRLLGHAPDRLDASLDSRGLRKHLGSGIRSRSRLEGPGAQG